MGKKLLFWQVSAHKCGSTYGIMLPPLLSSQIGQLEKLVSHFGRNREFEAIFLDHSYFEQKLAIFDISQHKIVGLSIGSCYLPFYHLKLTNLKDWFHILGENEDLGQYIWITPILGKKWLFYNWHVLSHKCGSTYGIMLSPLL